MTVISAIFTKHGIGVATDSLLTINQGLPKQRNIDWERPKIARITNLKACVSFWGCVGELKSEPTETKKAEWKWAMQDWLNKEANSSKQSTLEDLARELRDKLEIKLKAISAPPISKGLGIHLTGFERIKDFMIPEMFLISNFTSAKYDEVGELKYSRETFHTLKNVPSIEEHRNEEYRMIVKEHLDNGGVIFYNNGDPFSFNVAARAVLNLLDTASRNNSLQAINELRHTLPIVKYPIQVIKNFQEQFYLKNRRLVGGKIHELAFNSRGEYQSTTKD